MNFYPLDKCQSLGHSFKRPPRDQLPISMMPTRPTAPYTSFTGPKTCPDHAARDQAKNLATQPAVLKPVRHAQRVLQIKGWRLIDSMHLGCCVWPTSFDGGIPILCLVSSLGFRVSASYIVQDSDKMGEVPRVGLMTASRFEKLQRPVF